MGAPRPALLTLPLLTLLLLATPAPSTASDFTTNCPALCECKWVSGNKAADCSNKSLSTIPDRLSNEIQNLDLSGNPLHEITQNAFQLVGLSNLKRLILRNCNIQVINKNGLSSLGIVIEFDFSHNSIKILHPDTFRQAEKLRVVNLSNNKLEKIEDGVFRDLRYLQRIDLSNNHIHKVGVGAFTNSHTIKTIRLAYNNLSFVKLETINLLTNLSSMDLHNNPWKCDCNLMPFRNWIIDHNLYTSPTACAEPSALHKVLWSNTESKQFACQPSIVEPMHDNKMEAQSENVTLTCKAIGNPPPDLNWIQNSRVIDGDSKRSGDRRYHIHKSGHDMTQYINLTISGVRQHDRGEYTCVAKNAAGVVERVVTLSVPKSSGGAHSGFQASDIMGMVIGITIGAIAVMIVIAVLCFCFCRRRDSKRHLKSDMHSSNGEALIEGSVIPEMEKSLITTVNPVTKPPRIYDAPTSIMSGATEMSELNKTLLDNDSVFAPNEDESRSMDFADQQPKRSREALLGDLHSTSSGLHSVRGEPRAYPPDLLSFPPRAAQASPASSSASTAPDTSRLPPQPQVHSPIHSPIYGTNIFRTLPHSRSQSPFTSPVCPPTALPRQGYVTIPRRPRVPSWSSAASTVTPAVLGEYVEPVYDNLGLRTTADGSSVLSLNKAGLEQQFSPMRGRPLPATPGSYNGPLPTLYTPIEEHERAPSPAPSTPYSSTLPRMNGNSLHLQLSPNAEPQEPVNRRQRTTPETGFLKRFTLNDSDSSRQSPAPSLSGSRIYDTAAANNDTLGRSGKVPPRIPPKPRKKSPTDSDRPLFEDEGEDGTEV